MKKNVILIIKKIDVLIRSLLGDKLHEDYNLNIDGAENTKELQRKMIEEYVSELQPKVFSYLLLIYVNLKHYIFIFAKYIFSIFSKEMKIE